MEYTVHNAGSAFEGMNRDAYPELKSETVEASPLFLEMVKQVRDTSVPIHFSRSELKAGDTDLGFGPAVMYRNDNPANTGEREGK